jgi:NADPH2:quinone reductase
MTHRIQFQTPGGPEVLGWAEVHLADPGPGEARLRQTAIGVNYIDVYQRSGAYPVPPTWMAPRGPMPMPGTTRRAG